jgi:hypothetical protein
VPCEICPVLVGRQTAGRIMDPLENDLEGISRFENPLLAQLRFRPDKFSSALVPLISKFVRNAPVPGVGDRS